MIPTYSYDESGNEKDLEQCENEINICQRKTDKLTQKNGGLADDNK